MKTNNKEQKPGTKLPDGPKDLTTSFRKNGYSLRPQLPPKPRAKHQIAKDLKKLEGSASLFSFEALLKGKWIKVRMDSRVKNTVEIQDYIYSDDAFPSLNGSTEQADKYIYSSTIFWKDAITTLFSHFEEVIEQYSHLCSTLDTLLSNVYSVKEKFSAVYEFSKSLKDMKLRPEVRVRVNHLTVIHYNRLLDLMIKSTPTDQSVAHKKRQRKRLPKIKRLKVKNFLPDVDGFIRPKKTIRTPKTVIEEKSVQCFNLTEELESLSSPQLTRKERRKQGDSMPSNWMKNKEASSTEVTKPEKDYKSTTEQRFKRKTLRFKPVETEVCSVDDLHTLNVKPKPRVLRTTPHTRVKPIKLKQK